MFATFSEDSEQFVARFSVVVLLGIIFAPRLTVAFAWIICFSKILKLTRGRHRTFKFFCTMLSRVAKMAYLSGQDDFLERARLESSNQRAPFHTAI